MVNKKVIIGLGVLAVAGIGYYMWKNKKSTESKNSNSDVKLATTPSEMGAIQNEEEGSNVTGASTTSTPKPNRCPKGWVYANGKCNKLGANYVAGWENGQQAYSGYTAGWKDGAPAPCALGYEATLDPVKGTICTAVKKNIVRPYLSTINS